MFKVKREISPSKLLRKLGSSAVHGFISGLQKARIDEIESKFEPYSLPSVRWIDNQISILKYAFEYLKRWYD